MTELPVGSTGQARSICARLAKVDEDQPPIVVHAPSMRVVDGVHRVHVAIMRRLPVIKARLFHGSDEDAFMLAVPLNACGDVQL